jgi:acetyl-CoA carboxylase biotin carboxyl carrier protein
VELARLKALIELVGSHPIAELTLAENDTRIRIVKAAGPAAAPASPPLAAPRPIEPPAPVAAPAAPPAEAKLVRAPMPGLFHHAPTSGAPPFVAEGDSIAPSQQLCIIEAMKVFNAVSAEQAGRIEAVLVANGEMVQADQPLFRLG